MFKCSNMFQLINKYKENLIQFKMIGLYKLERFSFYAKLRNDMNRLLPSSIIEHIDEYYNEKSDYMSTYDEADTASTLQFGKWSIGDPFIHWFDIDHIEHLTDSQLMRTSCGNTPLIIAFCKVKRFTHVIKMLQVAKFRGNMYYQLAAQLMGIKKISILSVFLHFCKRKLFTNAFQMAQAGNLNRYITYNQLAELLTDSPFSHMIQHTCEYNDENYYVNYDVVDSVRGLFESNN